MFKFVLHCGSAVKPLIQTPVSHAGVLVQIPAAPLPIRSSANVSDDGSNCWAAATHMGNPDGIPGFNLAQPWLLWALGE